MTETKTGPRSVSPARTDPLDAMARNLVQFVDGIWVLMANPSWNPELPLTFQEARSMHSLGQGGVMTMSDFAAAIRVSLPTATHMVDRLVAKGIVERSRSEEDRRVVHVALSDAGRQHHRTVFANKVAASRRFLAQLGPTERGRFVDLLEQLAQLAASAAAIAGEDVVSK